MARVKRSIMKNKRRGKILQLAKGFRNARSTKYKEAKQAVIRAGQHAFAHRRRRKRLVRKQWQLKIGYAVRNIAGIPYNNFIDQLNKQNIAVDRKIMCQMIEQDMHAFARFVGAVTKTEVSVPDHIVQYMESMEAIDSSDVDDETDTEK